MHMYLHPKNIHWLVSRNNASSKLLDHIALRAYVPLRPRPHMSVYPRDTRWFAPIVKRLDDHPRLHAYNMSIHPRDNHYLVTTVTTPNCHILLPCNNLNQCISYGEASLKRLIENIYKQSFDQYLRHPVHDYTKVCSCVSAQTVHGMARAAGSQESLKMIFFFTQKYFTPGAQSIPYEIMISLIRAPSLHFFSFFFFATLKYAKFKGRSRNYGRKFRLQVTNRERSRL